MRARFRPGHLIAVASLVAGIWVRIAPDDLGEGRVAEWRYPLRWRAEAPFPRTVAGDRLHQGHAVGDRMLVQLRPCRIVAASVCSAEVLLAIAPKERIAAVHWLAADPRYSMVATAASGLPAVAAGPEPLLAVRPDLVITDPFTSAETQVLLEAAGVPVLRTAPVEDLQGIEDMVRMIGWAIGCDREAERLVDDMHVRVRELERGAAGLGAWRVMNLNGALETYGRGSLLDAVIRLAGARDLPAERGVRSFGVLDVESVLAWLPDALVVGVEPGQENEVREWLRQHPGLRLLPCVRNGRVVLIDNALLGSTSHHAVEIAAALQARLAAWERP